VSDSAFSVLSAISVRTARAVGFQFPPLPETYADDLQSRFGLPD